MSVDQARETKAVFHRTYPRLTEWQQEVARRKSAAADAALALEAHRKARADVAAAKPVKTRECSSMGCANFIDITNGILKRQNEALWRSCPGKGCRSWACQNEACSLALTSHIARCQKVEVVDI